MRLRRAFFSLFSARVELLVDRLEAVAIHVRVVLRGLNRGVAEEFLNGSQVGTAGEYVRRETVPQRVRARLAGETRPLAVFLDESPQEDSRQRSAGLAHEDVRAVADEDVRRAGQVRTECRDRGPASGTTRCLLPFPRHLQNAESR